MDKTKAGVEPSPEKLERDIEKVRGRMTNVASELDRRRQVLTDVTRQVRDLALPIGLVVGSFVLVSAIIIGVQRRRSSRLRRRWRVVARA